MPALNVSGDVRVPRDVSDDAVTPAASVAPVRALAATEPAEPPMLKDAAVPLKFVPVNVGVFVQPGVVPDTNTCEEDPAANVVVVLEAV